MATLKSRFNSTLSYRLHLLVFYVCLFLLCRLAVQSVQGVEAKSSLSFGSLPDVAINLPRKSIPSRIMEAVTETLHGSAHEWAWKDAPAYKNERLAYYQSKLREKGITDAGKVRLLTAQLIQEAGSLSEDTIGDHGCSFGIIQYNACAHTGKPAAVFLRNHPEWKSWTYQLDRMADMVAVRYEMYHGDIKRTIVHHNSPAAAKRNTDTKAGYFKSISKRSLLLI